MGKRETREGCEAKKEAEARRPRAGDVAWKPGAEGCSRKNEARGKEG